MPGDGSRTLSRVASVERTEIDVLRDESGGLTRDAIRRILPYEEEFLFVDSVSQLSEEEILAHYEVPQSAQLTHLPMMPSVLVSEAVSQAGMLLLHYSLDLDEPTEVVLTTVYKARYKSIAVPGDAMTQHVRMVASTKTGARLEGSAYVEERRLYQATFDFKLVGRRRLTSYLTQLQGVGLEPAAGRPAGRSLASRRKPTHLVPDEAPDVDSDIDDEVTERPITAPQTQPPLGLLTRRTRRRSRLVGGLLLLLVAAGVATGFAFHEEQPRALASVKVERADLEHVIRVTGEVINDRAVLLTALVDGQIAQIHVSRGEHVKAGQILASMDNRASAANQQRAQSKVQQETVRLREQKQRLSRLKRLAASGGVSEEALEKAALEVEAAVAALSFAQADVDAAIVEQDWQRLRAPFDAVVVDKTTEAGQWVEAGTKLFKLVATAGWEIQANLDAADSGQVRKGQRVELRSDAYPERVWETSLHWIGPVVERETERSLNTFPVRMGLGEKAPSLLLGQQIDVAILLERRPQALRLPFAALREIEGGGFEVAVLEQGRIQYRPVKTGLETETFVELLSGLEEGQQVVRLDGDQIKAGTPGHFVEADDPD